MKKVPIFELFGGLVWRGTFVKQKFQTKLKKRWNKKQKKSLIFKGLFIKKKKTQQIKRKKNQKNQKSHLNLVS